MGSKRKVKIHMEDQARKEKPRDNKEIGRISNDVVKRTVELDIKTFAKEAGENGKTYTPAIFSGKRKAEFFIYQEIFALDFDNSITVDEFLQKSEKYGIHPSFIYETFSCQPNEPHFRVVFILDCVLQSKEEFDIVMKFFFYIYPEADPMCKDVARMFFGGKKLLYLDEEAEVSILDLVFALQADVKERYARNYNREMCKIAKELSVAMENNLLAIYRLDDQEEIEENRILSNIIMINIQKSSSVYIIKKIDSSNHVHPQSILHERKCKVIQGKTLDELMNDCSLLRDHYDYDLNHQQKFLLATNLVHIKGGKSFFFDGLSNHHKKWEIAWSYIRKNKYKPQFCNIKVCPYFGECKCKTILDKIERKVERVGDDEKYTLLEEASSMLNDFMMNAVSARDKDIHLLKAQTALGKTEAYCNLAANCDLQKKLMIVVPTIDLQNEVCRRLEQKGVAVRKTTSVGNMLMGVGLEDLVEEIQSLYQKGFGCMVKKTVKRYLEKNGAKLSEIQANKIKEYLQKEPFDGKSCMVITHAMFLVLSEEILSRYEIIVDEDILMTIFKNTGSIEFGEIEALIDEKIFSRGIEERLYELTHEKNKTIGWTKLQELENNQIENIYERQMSIDASISDFMSSHTYYVDAEAKKIYYFKAKRLPDVKMTIISATMNEKLYRDFCTSRTIYMDIVPKVKYKGKLRQYTRYSMSRYYINTVGYEKIKKGIEKIINNSDDMNFISFKDYFKNYFKVEEFYFGKTEGSDEYKGQDLIVLGTPHNVPFIYQMIGAYLGYNAQDIMTKRRIKHNGFAFNIMTYETEDMQNLQLYFLHSELEQAIGRARLLRCECTVYVFSNLPCEQAEIIQDAFLE